MVRRHPDGVQFNSEGGGIPRQQMHVTTHGHQTILWRQYLLCNPCKVWEGLLRCLFAREPRPPVRDEERKIGWRRTTAVPMGTSAVGGKRQSLASTRTRTYTVPGNLCERCSAAVSRAARVFSVVSRPCLHAQGNNSWIYFAHMS